MDAGVRRARRGRVLRLAAAAEGLAGAVLVGRDGTPAWQVLRVLVVRLLTLGAMHALRRPQRATRQRRSLPGSSESASLRFLDAALLAEEPKRCP